MAEYIDRNAFVKRQCNNCDGACERVDCDCLNCQSIHRCDLIRELMDFPAADVQERVPRAWELHKIDDIHQYFTCPVCGCERDGTSRYCPECGTRINGERLYQPHDYNDLPD